MAIIESGSGTDLLEIDPTSLAARVILYGPDGNPLLYRADIGRGQVDVRVRQTATTGAGAAVWALRNSHATRMIYITRIVLQFAFDGTGAATLMKYELIKGKGCTAMSGGAVVTPLIKKTSIGQAPDVDARVLDTGLTQTGITQGAAFWSAAWARLTFSATQAGGISPQHILEFDQYPIELALNEVLSMRQVNTSVVGDCVLGSVEFQEG